MPSPKKERVYAVDNQLIMERWDYSENNKSNLNPAIITQADLNGSVFYATCYFLLFPKISRRHWRDIFLLNF